MGEPRRKGTGNPGGKGQGIWWGGGGWETGTTLSEKWMKKENRAIEKGKKWKKNERWWKVRSSDLLLL